MLSALLALVLLALSLVALVELALATLGRPPWLVDVGEARDELARRAWDDPVVILVSASLLLLGVGLLAVSLAPGASAAFPGHRHRGGDAQRPAPQPGALSRGSCDGTAGRPVGHDHGDGAAGIRVRADTTPLDAQQVRERVQQAISDRVRTLSPHPAPTISVSVRSREG